MTATRSKLDREAVPHSREAELQVLAAVLIDPSCLPTVRRLVTAGDFFHDDLVSLFLLVVDCAQRGVPIEPPALVIEFGRTHHDEKDVDRFVGLLHEIADSTTTAACVEHYCGVVAELARKRRLYLLSDQLRIDALNGVTSEEILADVGAELFEIGRSIARDDEQPAADVFEKWVRSVLEREQPRLFQVADAGSQLADFQVGAGLVTLIGAPPGWGKTALTNQLAFDALRLQEDLRVVLANVEMSPQALLDRQLARLTGIGHAWIRHRDYDVAFTPKLQEGIEELRGLMPRVQFMRPPFVLERLAEIASNHAADIVVVDYAQRFDTQQGSSDQRARANAVMDFSRRIADEGRGVIVVSALNRPQTKGGKYDPAAMGLASFRESSELEYGADAAYLLIRPDDTAEEIVLRCVKNRAGSMGEVRLRFKGGDMKFVDDLAVEGLEAWA